MTEAEYQADPGALFLRAREISKTFGGAKALDRVSLMLHKGEVHGLVGANGAGKSTFIRILAGLVQPDAGEIEIDGASVGPLTTRHSSELGLGFIHQELAFVPNMSVIENIMLGVPKARRMGLVDWRKVAEAVRPIAERVGITAPLNAPTKGLPVSELGLVSICRALVHKARLIVMDEPTAALSAGETERLFTIIQDLSRSGVAILYVSHRLDEIMELCDAVTVFRDGTLADTLPKSRIDRPTLVEAIVGRELAAPEIRTRQDTRGAEVLRVEGLERLPMVRDVSFSAHAGEIVGIGGLVGAGRSELAQLIFGANRPSAGRMWLDGAPFAPASPAKAVTDGIGYVPEERRSDGLFLNKSIAFNLSLANLEQVVAGRALPLVSNRKRSRLAEDTIRALSIRGGGPETPVGRLSGGNQQKVVIGRWLARRPHLLILDEPTRGVDVGARGEIHALIRDLADDGMTVIAISSEPDELPDLCHRVLVMAEGRIVRVLDGKDMTRSNIVAASYLHKETKRCE